MRTNYHSHTFYCDGSHAPEQYLGNAIEAGLSVYGFSGHSPVPFASSWAMHEEDLETYINEVNELKDPYKNKIEVLLSMEVDFIPGIISVESDVVKNCNLDYTIGSVHFLGQLQDGVNWEIDGTEELFIKGLEQTFRGNIKSLVKEYHNRLNDMISNYTPDIIGHIDKVKMHNKGNRFWKEDEDWYKELMSETLELAKSKDVVVEVNTRGIYKAYTEEPYPSIWIIQKMIEMGVPMQLNSDAHTPNEVAGSYDAMVRILNKLGLKSQRVLVKGKWTDEELK